MNIAQRFTLMVQGSLHSMLDSFEDPERSLYQLLLEMEEQLEAAKRATASAMANEDRLRARIGKLRQEADRWQDAARRALAQGGSEGRAAAPEADAREAIRRAEVATRQADRLAERLAAQEEDTARIRESVARLNEQIQGGHSRLQVLQARIRQGQARRAMGRAMQSGTAADFQGEFERLGDRIETWATEQDAYLRLDDELSGRGFARRAEAAAVDDAVESRLVELQSELVQAEFDEEGPIDTSKSRKRE